MFTLHICIEWSCDFLPPTDADEPEPQVLEDPTLGRYMVSTRALKVGDVILKEEPLVLGPLEPDTIVCLGCYKAVDGSYRYNNTQYTCNILGSLASNICHATFVSLQYMHGWHNLQMPPVLLADVRATL